jgi:hypothetical protein
MEKKRPMPEVKSCIGLHMALKKYYKFWSFEKLNSLHVV